MTSLQWSRLQLLWTVGILWDAWLQSLCDFVPCAALAIEKLVRAALIADSAAGLLWPAPFEPSCCLMYTELLVTSL